uniref:Uncharacterized protein n=1 Tax=Anguilla anguilla TaxID=7936 RepID=A0A0E9RAU1_ANGAN
MHTQSISLMPGVFSTGSPWAPRVSLKVL